MQSVGIWPIILFLALLGFVIAAVAFIVWIVKKLSK